MSWRARRYTRHQKEPQQPRMTKHHVPPTHPDKRPRIIRIDERHHAAYHLLFGAAPNMETCILILKRDWWPTALAAD